MYSLNAFLMTWELILYNAIPQTTEHYYQGKVTMKQINFSLSVGAFVYVAFLFPLIYIASKINNFRFITVFSSYLYVISCFLRLIPTFFNQQMKYAFEYLTAAIIIFQIGSIFTYSTPSNISALWFGSKERVLATTIGASSATVGVALNFLLTPFIIKIRWFMKDVSDFHGNMPLLLYGELILQSVLAIVMTIYFPASPKIAPSYSENYKRESEKENENLISDNNTNDNNSDEKTALLAQQNNVQYSTDNFDGNIQQSQIIQSDTNSPDITSSETIPSKPNTNLSFFKSLRILFTSPQFIMLLLYAGITSGACQAYNDNATYLCTVLHFSETTGGIVSSIDTVAAVVGAAVLPIIMRGCLLKKDKFFYFTTFLICGVSFAALLITMPCPDSWVKHKSMLMEALRINSLENNQNQFQTSQNQQQYQQQQPKLISTLISHIFPQYKYQQQQQEQNYSSLIKPNLPLIISGSTLGGIFAGLPYSLFFETAAEISYPISEAISGAAITFATNITYFTSVFVFGVVGAGWTSIVALILVLVGTLIVPFSKISFNRSAIEEQERAKDQNITNNYIDDNDKDLLVNEFNV
ncbi:MAG: hypothetical protein EZS28_023405 [Streblomastix strix]|uniref:Uncharacterized protein n=1 Tax=Streblomastix strix TaxID=222440 RepID=A0A5J4VFA5_9EUKA|nr:MAG: hypothetical protein EZS28_023405 [Streblomastix strix]